MSAEALSKQYWLNFGLLGFLLISPRMLTSRERMVSYTGVRLCRAVMITRIAPDRQRRFNDALTFHQIVVFRNLFGRATFFNIGEQGHEYIFGEWPDVGLRESVCVSCAF